MGTKKTSKKKALDKKAMKKTKGGAIVAVNGGGNTPNGEASTNDGDAPAFRRL